MYKLENKICELTDQTGVVKMQCRHRRVRNRLLVQEQGRNTYVISCCNVCAGIALRSNCGFFEMPDFPSDVNQTTSQAKNAGNAA